MKAIGLPLIILAAALAVASAVQARKAPAKAVPAKEAAATAPAAPCNDFPTQERVEYVFKCMADHGGDNLDNLYHCVCAVDRLAAALRFDDYLKAQTFANMAKQPGEKGAAFRDAPEAKLLAEKLDAARKDAAACFPAKPAPVAPVAEPAAATPPPADPVAAPQ